MQSAATAAVCTSSPSSAECAVASWNGGKRTFLLPPTVSIRDTFGAAAFIVDSSTGEVASLDAAGRPPPPLCCGARYVLYGGGSKELRKQCHTLRGQLRLLQDECKRLRVRSLKHESIVREEIAQVCAAR